MIFYSKSVNLSINMLMELWVTLLPKSTAGLPEAQEFQDAVVFLSVCSEVPSGFAGFYRCSGSRWSSWYFWHPPMMQTEMGTLPKSHKNKARIWTSLQENEFMHLYKCQNIPIRMKFPGTLLGLWSHQCNFSNQTLVHVIHCNEPFCPFSIFSLLIEELTFRRVSC